MTDEEKQKAIEGLSPRGKRLWESVQNSVNFFVWKRSDEPKLMIELEKAGLVEAKGRVVKIARCWVPVGTLPFVAEAFPGEPQIFQREAQEPPTTPGYYYCRDHLANEDEKAIIREVVKTTHGLMVDAGINMWPLNNYQWFGPVPQCEEFKP